jgi:hypothetical protein
LAFEFGPRLLARFRFAATNRHLCAGAGELLGDRFADAARRAGDERDLSLKIKQGGHDFAM